MSEITLEEEWTAELGEPVEIREFEDWHEFDIYIGGQFMVTVHNLVAAELWLAKYAAVRNEVTA